MRTLHIHGSQLNSRAACIFFIFTFRRLKATFIQSNLRVRLREIKRIRSVLEPPQKKTSECFTYSVPYRDWESWTNVTHIGDVPMCDNMIWCVDLEIQGCTEGFAKQHYEEKKISFCKQQFLDVQMTWTRQLWNYLTMQWLTRVQSSKATPLLENLRIKRRQNS